MPQHDAARIAALEGQFQNDGISYLLIQFVDLHGAAKVKMGKKTKNLVIGQVSFNLAAGATATLNVKLAGAAKTSFMKKCEAGT